VMRQITLLLYR